MLRASDGRLYDVTAATPPPALDDRTIRLTSRPSNEMNFCMQGTRLTWTYTGGTCSPSEDACSTARQLVKSPPFAVLTPCGFRETGYYSPQTFQHMLLLI